MATRAEAPSGEIEDYLGRQIRSEGPGLVLGVVDAGTLIPACHGSADVHNGVRVEQDTIFHIASCGKQFTALGILMLAEERKLHLDDPIGRHLGPLAGFRVTIRQLLHHTSGIRDFYDEDGIEEVLARCERPINADIVRIYADLGCPMAEDGIEPGDAFDYSNSGYDLLGAVIEHLSGEPYRDFFQRRVFGPPGMRDTFSLPDRRSRDRRCAKGYELGEGGELVENTGSELDGIVGSGSFHSTVPDLCLFDRALRANSFVSEGSMCEALTSGRTNDGEPTGYGFGWYFGDHRGMCVAEHEGEWNGH
jgi:CubicO group peptidase (beta-lactamase class C family)